MTQRKMNRAALARYTELRNLTLYSMLDFQQPDLAKKLLPTEWRGIATAPVPEKARLTIRIDADVAKFFSQAGAALSGQDQPRAPRVHARKTDGDFG